MKRKLFTLLLFIAAMCSLAIAEANPAAIPAKPNFSPGPSYGGSERKYQGMPSIERAPNGRLWAAWYGGGITEDMQNYVLLSTSGDNGQTWEQVLVLDPDGSRPVRAFDPCLWHDPQGKLWLFWTQELTGQKHRALSSFVIFAITTTDSGKLSKVWSKPRQIFEGAMLNKPTVAKDGRWLLPISSWYTAYGAKVVVSTDHGHTFRKLGAANIPKPSRSADETMLIERKNGTLWMLVRGKFHRPNNSFTGIGESVSSDKGKTWPEMKASAIPHAVTARFFIRRLNSGRLLLVRHNQGVGSRGHSHLKAYLSEDDGHTWKGGLLLDGRANVTYPDGVQAAKGAIHVIYDHERLCRKEIFMAVFTEKDVMAGKLIVPYSRLRVRVNKATGINPLTPCLSR